VSPWPNNTFHWEHLVMPRAIHTPLSYPLMGGCFWTSATRLYGGFSKRHMYIDQSSMRSSQFYYINFLLLKNVVQSSAGACTFYLDCWFIVVVDNKPLCWLMSNDFYSTKENIKMNLINFHEQHTTSWWDPWPLSQKLIKIVQFPNRITHQLYVYIFQGRTQDCSN
jgi:hypothetical protein